MSAFAHKLPDTPLPLRLLARRAIEATRTLNLYEGDDAEWNRRNAQAIDAAQAFREAFYAHNGMTAQTMRELFDEGIIL